MKSLRRRLLLWLLLGQLLLVAVVGGVTYNQVRREVDELMDSQLQQVAGGLKISGDLRFVTAADSPPTHLGENELLVQLFDRSGRRVYSSHPDIVLPLPTRRGFSEQSAGDEQWRLFATDEPTSTIVVAQPFAARREASAEVAFASVGPVLALIVLLSILVWAAVEQALRPLDWIGAALGERTPAALEPLPLDNLPIEVAPLAVALNDLLRRLGEALAGQRRFVADAAHELRTPLAALSLQAQLLARARDEDERQAAMQKVGISIERAKHLVQQLLTLARLEPDGEQPPTATVSLTGLAQAVIAEQAQLALAGGIDLGLVAGEEQVQVSGDAGSLQVMISNLVANAVHFTPAGGRIDVAVYTEGADAIMTVVDTGPGIPTADRERVFDRFYRRFGSDVPGSGLGLAIVHEVVKRHGGVVRLDDPQEHPGLRVTVRLPQAH